MRKNTRIEGLPRFFGVRERKLAYLSLALSLACALALSPVRAQGDEHSGKKVVDSICAACHATGVEGAPKIGDRVDTVKNGRGQIVVKMPDPPGAYVDAVVPASFGPGGMNALYEVRLNARRSSR